MAPIVHRQQRWIWTELNPCLKPLFGSDFNEKYPFLIPNKSRESFCSKGKKAHWENKTHNTDWNTFQLWKRQKFHDLTNLLSFNLWLTLMEKSAKRPVNMNIHTIVQWSLMGYVKLFFCSQRWQVRDLSGNTQPSWTWEPAPTAADVASRLFFPQEYSYHLFCNPTASKPNYSQRVFS